jgi:hypothetical protein
VIRAAALCPHPPLLFRELTGRQDVASSLRAACVAVLQAAVADADVAVVVGGADRTRTWDASLPPDVRRFGGTGPRTGSGLPLSLGVGARLLDLAGWTGPVERVGLAWDAGPVEVRELVDGLSRRPEQLALLVLGDGSARRGDTAPGYLDERAFPFDDEVARALAEGDARALLDLDAALADELMVLGASAFRLLGAAGTAGPGAVRATLAHREAPFGVSYFVCLWELS